MEVVSSLGLAFWSLKRSVQLGLQFVLAAVGCCSFERVHGRSVYVLNTARSFDGAPGKLNV